MSSYEDPHLSPPTTNVGGGGDGDGKDDYVIVNNSDVTPSDDRAPGNHENVAKLSVEGNDNDNLDVIGYMESDRLENGVKVDAEELTVDNGVNVREESEGGVEGGGFVEESREIALENKDVAVENGGSDGNVESKVNVSVRISEVSEGSEQDLVVDAVKEDSVPESVVDEVKENNDLKPVVDEVKEGDVPETVADEVKESNNPKPVVDEVKESDSLKPAVDEVKEGESVIETGDNGSVSVDRNGARSLDVDNNNENGVYDGQETDEVEAEDSTAANGVAGSSEPSEIKEGSGMDPAGDEVNGSNEVTSVVDDEVKKDEPFFANGDNGHSSVDKNGARFLDVDSKNENSVYDTEESAEVVADDSTVVSSVRDAPEPSDANEGSVVGPMVDKVKEINDMKHVVDDEVKEDESVLEIGDSGNVSIDSIGPRSLDVDSTIKNSVYDAQEPAEVESVETEDKNAVISVPDAIEPSEVKDGGGVDPVVDEVKESNNAKPVVDNKGEEGESFSKTGDNANASDDGNGSRSLNVDDNNKNSSSDAQESAKVETEDSTVLNTVQDAPAPSEAEAQISTAAVEAPQGGLEAERHTVLPVEIRVEVQETEPERLKEEQAGSDNNGDVHGVDIPVTELNSAGCLVMESKPLETDVSDHSVEDRLEEAQSLGGDVKASLPLVAEDNGLPLDDAIPAEHLSVSQQQNLAPADRDNEKWDLIEKETKTDKQGDVDPVANWEIQESLDSETAGSELDQGEKGENTDIIDSNSSDNNGDVHGVDIPVTELNSAGCLVMESKPLETDVSDHSVEDRLEEAQSLGGDVKVSLPLAEDKGLPLDDAIPAEHLSVSQQQNLAPADRENEKRDLIEKETKTDKQGDVDPVANGEIQESLDSKTAGSELDQGEKGENTDLIDSNSSDKPEENLPDQTGGGQNQGNLEFTAPLKENPVSIVVGQPEESKIDSTAGVEENSGALADMQLNTTDKSVLEDEFERVDEERKSEVIGETGGSLLASNEEGFLEDQVAEQTESIDVLDKNISLEECSSAITLKLENTLDASKDSKVQSTDNTATDAGKDDQGGYHSRDDTKSKSVTLNREIDVPIKSSNVSDSTSTLEISFGSFGSVSPFSQNGINFPSDALKKSNAVSTANAVGLLKSTENGDPSVELNSDEACAHVAQPGQVNEVSASSAEGIEADSSDTQNINPDLVRRPFYWLIKVPRFDEGKFKDQLRQIEIELAEKTKTRDAVQVEFSKKQAYCRELKSICEAVNSEVKAARDLVWAKSREIESAHSLINLARHGITVEDLDKKIHSLEHRLQHQTLNNLREEKELVREIKQLNIERQKLSANRQRHQEVQQARNQRGQTEEQLTALKKEIDGLRDNLLKVDECFRAAKNKHDEESVFLNDLREQLKSADDIRHDAYTHLKSLKKQLNEKNAPFYKAKDDLRLAYNYVEAGKIDSLERHCVNQVETIMDIWNTSDKFRKEYIQCNMRRTVYKFGTLDGTCLGIDEVPPSLGNFSDNKVNITAKANWPTEVLTAKRDLPVEPKITEDRKLEKVEQKKASPVKKIEATPKVSLVESSSVIEIEEVKEEPPKLTKEEEELARKAEQLRKEEEAVRLREQRRLEEKAKAEEALERKRRNALKAQARAEFKARKEAEEKEKEREKRAKKKGKKRGEITEKEPAQSSEPSSESVKEPEITEKPATKAKRPQKASIHLKQIKTTKPIPPALRNKGKRGLLRYWPYACIVLLAVALFYLGSFERIQTIKHHISALLHR